MYIENAVQATEVVKFFLEKMNPNLAFSPKKATQATVQEGGTSMDYWLVEASWGFQVMSFKVRKSDGQITEYESGPIKVAQS